MRIAFIVLLFAFLSSFHVLKAAEGCVSDTTVCDDYSCCSKDDPTPAGMMLTLRGSLQLTPNRLSPSEQLRLGGAFSVRGYSEGDYLADYGGFVTNELSVPTYFFPAD